MKISKMFFAAGLTGILFFYANQPLLQEKIILDDLIFERKGCSEYGSVTLENIRGLVGTRAYPNQDRACAITIKKPVLHGFRYPEISIGELKSGKVPKPTPILDPGIFVVGVFDGHGKDGDSVSSLTRFLVCDYFKKFFQFSKTKILYYDFLILAQSIQSTISQNISAQESGTTACFCMLEGPLRTQVRSQEVYRAVFSNVGDSRAIVISGNEIVFSTVDHKPETQSEKERIEAAGGSVINGYAWGSNGHGFALSRSWGDCIAHTNGVLSSTPEIYSFGVPTQASNPLLRIEQKNSYLLKNDIIVFATDGLWDVFTNQEVTEYICTHKQKGKTLQIISEELAHKARTGDNAMNEKSRDDITVLIVQL